MKKILSIALVVLMVVSSLSLFVNAKDYTSENATTKAPVCDGKISSGEYKGAMVTSIDPSSSTYYAYNAARTQCLKFSKADIEARGSRMINKSTIYTLPTVDGIYFAFDVADTSIGGNYVRSIDWHDGPFRGDSVMCVISQDNKGVTDDKLMSRDSLRIAVCPFVNDYRGANTGKREINILSGGVFMDVTPEGATSPIMDVIDTTGMLDEGVTSDESGYIVEFFVSWEVFDYLGWTGPMGYKDGTTLYMNYMIVDSLGIKPGTNEMDWGVFALPVNSNFIETGKKDITDNDGHVTKGILIQGGTNWSSFAPGTAQVMKFVVKGNQPSTTTSKKETQKPSGGDTGKNTETEKKAPKKVITTETVNKDVETFVETDESGNNVSYILETDENGNEVKVEVTLDENGKLVKVETETETETETEKETATETETKKETKKETEKTADAKSEGFPVWALILIIVVVLAAAGVGAFFIIKKKKQ